MPISVSTHVLSYEGSAIAVQANRRREAAPRLRRLVLLVTGSGFGASAGTAEHPREVGLADQHLARLRALVAGDHAAALEHVDQPPGARVADPQAPLQHRDRGGLGLHDEVDRLVEQVVLVGVEVALLGLALGLRARLEQLLLELGLALLRPVRGDAGDLLLGHEGALDPLHLRGSRGPEQHVALAEQRLRPALVEDHPRVGLRGDGEGDPGRDVDLDRPGDDVGRRALGREHEVDAGRARLLGQADDRVLDLGRGDHHQVGELVDHAEHVRQRRLADPLAGPVELGEVAAAGLGHDPVAVLHLADQVGEHVGRQPRRGDHRGQQVGDVLVVVELDPLRVDQHHPHLVRRGAHQDRAEHGVDAARLARPGGAGDQHVGHLLKVGPDRVAGDVLAQPADQRRGLGRAALVDVAEPHQAPARVRHLDADRLLAGDRGEDADVGGGERVGEVVGELGDLLDLRARRQPQLVARDVRAR